LPPHNDEPISRDQHRRPRSGRRFRRAGAGDATVGDSRRGTGPQMKRGHAMRLVLIVGLLLATVPPASAFQSSTASLPPPATGAFAYNTFVPPATAGASYTDPVFGEVVGRVTLTSSGDDLYARNMWWNADETRYLHRVC